MDALIGPTTSQQHRNGYTDNTDSVYFSAGYSLLILALQLYGRVILKSELVSNSGLNQICCLDWRGLFFKDWLVFSL